MNIKCKIILIVTGILLLLSIIILSLFFVLGNKSPRGDGARRITNCWPASCQNPVFSPDNKYVMYTQFEKGYNNGPAKLMKINLETKKSQVIVDLEGDNVNVPFGSWISNKIVFSYENGIAIADDGTNVEYLMENKNNESYIEPVFNPTDINEVVFEIVKGNKHQIGFIKDRAITELTDGSFDDRLPSWSPDGKKILWQRTEYGKDNWQIMVADIVYSSNPEGARSLNDDSSQLAASNNILQNITILTQGQDDTDNSWVWDGEWILSSHTGDGEVPNIFAISTDGKNIKRITQSDHEDSAPSASPDGNWVAFESHLTKNPNSTSDIWIITQNF